MKKISLLCLSSFLLTACSAYMTSMINPEASYLNGQTVKSVPKSQSITVVGSAYDETGNFMPSYPMPIFKEHKIVHISPVPKFVMVACEHEYTQAAGHLRQNITKRGFDSVKHDFQAGKTYMVFCNIQANNRFRIVAREVPDGTGYQSRWSKSKQPPQPTAANRVRFEITGKSSQNFWRWAGGSYMAIRGWDGNFNEKVELAAPVNRVEVQCQMNREVINVPLTGDFRAGKTYRLGCQQNSNGLIEAYIVEVK